MIKRLLVSCAALLGAAGIACGGDSGGQNLPQKPQIITDRDTIVDQAIYAGQQKTQNLGVTNGGRDDLVLSGYTLTGDASVVLINSTLAQTAGMSNTVQSGKTGYITMTCRPTSAGQTVTATLTINSNAENKPSKVISVSCGPAVAPPP